jgi:hypothetical protein
MEGKLNQDQRPAKTSVLIREIRGLLHSAKQLPQFQPPVKVDNA